MSLESSSTEKAPLPFAAAPALGALAAWSNVLLAALLMLATLPGRTQGLGLITEPMLRDLSLDHVSYAKINVWATLLGSAACLPAGWIVDRLGLRASAVVLLLLLAAVVWQMSAMAGGLMIVFTFLLLTRAIGQSALSVTSITAVGKSFGAKAGWAMGVYSLLLSIFFAVAFVVVGGIVRDQGWRVAWGHLAIALLVIAILAALCVKEPERTKKSAAKVPGMSLGAALQTRVFWVFAISTALFSLVSSGLGLFNEAVLAERGFDQKTFHSFLAVTTLFALVGQLLCGWLSLRRPITRLLAVAMFLYAAGLATLPLLQSHTQLWIFAAVFGVAAGFVTVIFFAVWGLAFGRSKLGRIQGAAQMLTVFASALGPLLFAKSHAATGSYGPLCQVLAVVVLVAGLVAWWTKLAPVDEASLQGGD
ncbi:CynX/NimT family MFS transporter [Haloferula chungangensis]|uniref:CynX/NimT family MFS transporter n=1 Tax=Haloferula chungangensis TaxID=1048331 RepID=A0ABW2L8P5_9BACT